VGRSPRAEAVTGALGFAIGQTALAAARLRESVPPKSAITLPPASGGEPWTLDAFQMLLIAMDDQIRERW
jgi:hypothetical protein